LVTVLLLSSRGFSPAHAQARSQPAAIQKEASVKTRATGAFDVKVLPLPADDGVDTGGFSRLSLDKRFTGDLEGTSRGQMVAARTAVEGSAAYVALEQVSGTLHGRRGSFMLQHNGTMSRGAQELRISVVPDSGTDQLIGLAGTMKIIIEAGKHTYEFEYTLAD
jgi:hypothetical protein